MILICTLGFGIITSISSSKSCERIMHQSTAAVCVALRNICVVRYWTRSKMSSQKVIEFVPTPPKNIKYNAFKLKGKKSKNKKKLRPVQGKQPFARTYNFKGPKFERMSSQNNDQTVTIRGMDLVQAIPVINDQTSQSDGIFLTIPSNPAYWKGTRIGALAQGYAQFRPLEFSVKYVPSVPVTVPGQVVYGTLWNTGTKEQNLQQSLATSNGGGITTCYQYAWSRVSCNKQTLPQQFYVTGDNMSDEHVNPFTWFAFYTGNALGDFKSVSAPGYAIVYWKYKFTVGIGESREYSVVTQQTPQMTQWLKSNYNLELVPIWGVAIGILKNLGMRILRKCAVVILREVQATLTNVTNDQTYEELPIYPGTTMAVDVSSLDNTNAGQTVIHSASGRYLVNDDTPVAIYMCGSPLTRVVRAPTPPEPPKLRKVWGFYLNSTGISNASFDIVLNDRLQFAANIADSPIALNYFALDATFVNDGWHLIIQPKDSAGGTQEVTMRMLLQNLDGTFATVLFSPTGAFVSDESFDISLIENGNNQPYPLV